LNLDDFSRVADALNNSIETTLASWFANGVVIGAEFSVGSTSGEAGQSLRIRIKGDKVGVWSDFSTGDAGRDLISLYALKEGMTQGKACVALAAQLGMELADTRSDSQKKRDPIVSKNIPQKSAPAQAAQGVERAKPRTEWTPILPVPAEAGAYPRAHIKRGRPQMQWEYRDQDGQLLGVIYRFTNSEGGKEVLPCVYAEHPATGAREWRWISFRDPRPLYIKGAMRPDLSVVVVEGEKCVDACHSIVGDLFDVVSWPGGGKAVDKASWDLLAGRHVILWPDCDSKVYAEKHPQAGVLRPENEQPGIVTMRNLAAILEGLGCTVDVIAVPPPGQIADGWDVADLVGDGGTRDEVLAWLKAVRRVAPKPSLADSEETVVAGEDVPDWINEAPIDSGISTERAASASAVDKRHIRLAMIQTSNGGVKGCRENVYTAMKLDPALQGLVALDQFALLQVKRKLPPWHSELGEWNEGDDFHLGMYLANNYGLVIASVGDIEKAVAQIARENAFNPVTDFFDQCHAEWDGQSRVDGAFSRYWGALDSEYMRLISIMFFVGLAKRAYTPGVKHDYAPVFEGTQGKGKSTALSILGGDWFADTPFRMGEKDGYLAIQGVLIYEIAELEQFNRSEVTAVKAFMSSRVDRYREPYGRRMKNQPRRTVFAATTNQDEYFKDATGNRRFWPVDARNLDLIALEEDRAQLIGEAVHLMREGVKWYPTAQQQIELISPHQEDRELADEWSGRIWEYLEGYEADGTIPTFPKRIDKVTSREILTRALHMEIAKISAAKSETTRVGNIMRKFGWIKKKETTGAREGYYLRPDSDVPGIQEGGDDDLPL
jgi:putative DNA primase/helicase